MKQKSLYLRKCFYFNFYNPKNNIVSFSFASLIVKNYFTCVVLGRNRMYLNTWQLEHLYITNISLFADLLDVLTHIDTNFFVSWSFSKVNSRVKYCFTYVQEILIYRSVVYSLNAVRTWNPDDRLLARYHSL